MSKPKQIITSGFEFIKDSASQLGGAFSPEAIIKEATKAKKRQADGEDEFTKYLREELGGKDLSEEELEKIREKAREEDEKDLTKIREQLHRPSVPSHMKLAKEPEAKRPYEETIEDLARKKAEEVEVKKIQQQKQPIVVPGSGDGKKKSKKSKMPGLPFFAKRKASVEGWGGKMDSKIG